MPDTEDMPPRKVTKAAPRRLTDMPGRSEAPTRAPIGATKRKVLIDGITNMYGMTAIPASMVHAGVGNAIMASAENAAVAWVDLAETNPSVLRTLEKLIATNAYTKVVQAHVPIIFAVMEAMHLVHLATEEGNNGPEPGTSSAVA